MSKTRRSARNLEQTLKSDQIKRYKTLSHNIILTDYLHFVWINRDGVQCKRLVL